jgi:hypothetical protein
MARKTLERSEKAHRDLERSESVSSLEKEFDKRLKSFKNNDALIKPISDEYSFCTNGIYFFVGRMGTGKTYEAIKHIFILEKLFNKPFYHLVIFCSTSGSMDKTAEQMQSLIKTPLLLLNEENLMPFLTHHLKWKMRYYAIIKYALSRFKEPNSMMEHIIKKHDLQDIDEKIAYVAMKLAKYGITEYPFRTLLVMDDFAGSPLLKNINSPLVRIMTKTRHYNLTCIIISQTFKGICLNARRLATDAIVFSKFSEEDFLNILHQLPNDLNYKEALEKYKQLIGPHSKLIMNMVDNKYSFINN